MGIGVLIKIVKHFGMIKMAKDLGYDFILLDNEHGNFSFQELHDFCMYASGVGITSIVRISEISKTEISKTLDCGASGLLIPMVETKEDVIKIMEYAKYPPMGRRGYAGGANTNYARGVAHSAAIQDANQHTLVYVQIETARALTNAVDICSSTGLNGVVIGPADLSISMKYPDDYFQKDMIDAMGDIAHLCQDSAIDFGIIGGDAMHQMFANQTNFVVNAIDVDLIYGGLKQRLDIMKNIKEIK